MTSNESSQSISSQGLSPTVKKLGAVSFFADVASEMLYPITPLFLTSVFGASMTSVGIIEGLAEAIASLMKTYSGYWSDQISKRKPFIILGYFLAAISKPLIGVSQSWIQVLFARGLDRTGKGLRSAPRDALIAESSRAENQGAAFGWHRGMDTLGAALGPLLTVSFLTANAGQDLRQLYWWALIPGLLSVIIACTVKETLKESHAAKRRDLKGRFKDLNPNLKIFFLAWTLFSLVNSSDVFLLMKAKSDGASMATVVLMYCAYNLTYALSSPWIGKLSDSIPRKYLLMLGLFIYSLVYLGMALATSTWHLWVLFLSYGIYMGATDGVGKALIIDYCPENLKATALGLLGTTSGIATLVASVSAGILWDHWGANSLFYFASTGAFISIVLLTQIQNKKGSL